jgi:hypothetical protein
MRHPQVVIYESDGRLAALLRDVARDRHWTLHEPRQPEGCLRLLRRGDHAVLVLRLGQDAVDSERALVRELSLLERVTRLCPDAATVVVGEADHAELAAQCWDLGAAYVLFPPRPRDWLPEILAGFLEQGAVPTEPPPLPPKPDA